MQAKENPRCFGNDGLWYCIEAQRPHWHVSVDIKQITLQITAAVTEAVP